MKMLRLSVSFFFLLFTVQLTAQFTTGNLVVVRLGDGSTVYNGGAAARCFLDEYTTGGTLIQTVAMPVTTSGTNRKFFLNNGFTGGLITLSSDKRYLLLPGYDVAEFSQPVASFTSAIAPRIIARIDKNENINTSTVTGAFGNENPESAFSTNGTDIWILGGNGVANEGGLRFLTFGSSSSVMLNNINLSAYQLQVFNNQLYASCEFNNISIGAVGTGIPGTGSPAIINLPGLPSSNTTPVGFFMADLNAAVAGLDVLYVCDRNGFGGPTGNTITKYSLVSGSWVKNNSLPVTNPIGLTGSISGNSVTLYATSSTTLFSLTDATGYNANMTASLSSLAAAPVNTTFKGIAFAPSEFDVTSAVTEVSTMAITKLYQTSSDALLVEWSSKKPGNSEIHINDIAGRVVASSAVKSITGLNRTHLSISALPAGTYFVRIIKEKEILLKKFVKQ